jgi:WD40 repeat protein
LRPNPEALPNLAAVLFDNSQCKVIDFTNGSTQCVIPLDNVTAVCWSPKGKQIVCGKLDGGLEHFDMNGSRKDALSISKSMSAGQGEEEQDRFGKNSFICLGLETHATFRLKQ